MNKSWLYTSVQFNGKCTRDQNPNKWKNTFNAFVCRWMPPPFLEYQKRIKERDSSHASYWLKWTLNLHLNKFASFLFSCVWEHTEESHILFIGTSYKTCTDDVKFLSYCNGLGYQVLYTDTKWLL